MATYKEIQKRVKEQNGFVPKTCWIADVKSNYGLTSRIAANRLSSEKRAHPCPPEKQEAIELALKYFKMIAD